jgi:hypothetical protein
MSCNILRKPNGAIDKVVSDNQQPSLLYKEATKKFGKEMGLDIYLASKSDDFQDNIILSQNQLDENSEPKLNIVLNYLSLQNESKEPLTIQQKLDLKNTSLGVENFSVQKLVDAFYSEGIFNVSPRKLKKSGLYSEYEIANLANDVNLQEKVKQSLEALKNTGDFEVGVEFTEDLEKTGEVNSFGKLTNINPNLVQKEVLEKLAGTNEEQFEANLAELEYPNFQKKLEKPVKKSLIEKVIEQLRKNKLANNIYIYTNAQIEQKLRELGWNSNINKQIIGEKGAQNLDQIEEVTYRMDNLLVAREMEKAGKTPKEIRLATGWEKGADGIFRYEIQDGIFNDTPLNFNASVPFMEEPTSKTSLSEIYNNEELFKTYPKLKNTSVYVYNTENPIYDENKMFVYKGNIYINSRTYDTRSNTLRLSFEEGTEIAHEVSHIIQGIEGFARGSSINWNRERVRESIDAIKTKIRTGVRREGFSGRYDDYIESLLAKSIGEDLIEAVVFVKDIDSVVDALAEKAYINFAGEVEARNVQARFFMSPQQRLEQTLQETQDIPFEDQFVLQSQIQFQRVADQLPKTLQVFERPEFVKLQGKQVNPITVLNSLNQSGIKQIERDLIKQVIEDNYKGQNKVNYDELETTVRANIMPLERITTSSYADYGMDNLGNGNYGEAKTLILNAPIEHGVTGHFSGDFKASGRQNIKYQAKQLNDNTWVAVEEGYGSQANNNNIYQYVGTAGTKEAVNVWIENYNPSLKEYTLNTEGIKFKITTDYKGDKAVNIKVNGIDFDSGFIGKLSDEDAKKEALRLLNERQYVKDRADINKGMFGHIRVWQDGEVFTVAELQSDTYQKNNAKNLLIGNQSLSRDELSKLDNSLTKKITTELKEEGYEVVENGSDYQLLLKKEIVHTLKVGSRLQTKDEYLYDQVLSIDVNSKVRKILDNGNKWYEENLKKQVLKKKEDRYNSLSPQEKQFIASQKIWEQRMVREAIKEASLSGATSLRFPTPYTLSVIEGYIKGGGLTSTTAGDIIEYLGEDYIILNGSEDDEVRIIPVRNMTRVSTQEFYELKENEDIDIYDYYLGDIGEGVESSDGEYFYFHTSYRPEGLETIEQGGIDGATKETFELSDLNDTQQTVARKYEEIAKILKKEKPVKLVTDENGFDWYEAKITPQDTQKPVIAFQKNPKDVTMTTSGFVYKGDVYLNKDKMKLDTPVHELGHLYLNYLKSNNSDIYERGLQLAQSEDAKEYVDYVEKTQPQLTGEAKLNEILAQAIGDNGAKLADKSWIGELWDEIKKLFGLSEYTTEQVQNMTLKQFTQAISVDLYKNQLLQEMQGYKKAEVFMEIDRKIVQAKNTNTAAVLPLVAKQIDKVEILQDINQLQQYDLDILQANQEDTTKILGELESNLIGEGIDVAGLSGKEINAELISFLGELEVFINKPTAENTKIFADVYDAYFEKDLSPKKEIVKREETDRDFVKLNTNLSEEEVYEQQGLIKVKDGLYIRTNKQDLDTLYASLETYKKHPKNTTLKEYVQNQISKLEYFKNSDNAEAVYLYKMYFDVVESAEEKTEKTNVNFTGNYEYLTTEFVSDFYIEMLKEREKNSEIYKNFYSNFDINENGIYLKNDDNITMSQINEYADENLKQYSIISKQMPLLAEQEIKSETKQVRRDAILNSPQNLEKYQGQYHKLSDNNLILKNSGEEFIKVGGNIFEAVDTDGNLTLYSRLNSVVGEYNTFENEAPKTDVKIEDYSYLNTQPEKFLNEKKYLSKSAKEKINKENFDCI